MPQTFSRNSRHWLTDLAALAMAITVFYFLWLGSYPLFTPDEGRYTEVAREMIRSGDYITPRLSSVPFLDKPVLYYWLQAASLSLFGIREWAVRLFPAFFGVFSCLAVYVCGRRLFDRRTGLLSAIILAASPLFFGAAHYANLDLEVAAFISLTLLCFVTAIQAGGRERHYFLFAAYGFAGLAFLTKGMIGVAFPAIIALAWISLRSRFRLLAQIHLIKGILLAGIIALPWYFLAQRANPDFLQYFFINQQVTRFLSLGQFNNATPWWFYFPIVLAGFFPWSAFIVQALAAHTRKIWQERENHAAELFLLLWLVIIFAFFSIPQSKTVGYILPVFPALALLTGKYLSDTWETARRAELTLAVVIFAVLGTLLAMLLLDEPYKKWIDLPSTVTPYFIAMATVLFSSALLSLCLLSRAMLSTLFKLFLTSAAVFLLLLTLSAKHLNTNTAQPLIPTLQAVIQPDDEIVNYYKFYQDVPLYLDRTITLVADWHSPDIASKDNWVRELWYGMNSQQANEYLIDDNQFRERWNSEKRLFVFVNENYFTQFKTSVDHYYLIERYNDILLFSNKGLSNEYPHLARHESKHGQNGQH